MHTVDLMEQALAAAERLGFSIRHEWLGGSGGGYCEFGGKKWLFVDLALNNVEQLDQVLGALKHNPGLATLALSRPLLRLVEMPERKAA